MPLASSVLFSQTVRRSKVGFHLRGQAADKAAKDARREKDRKEEEAHQRLAAAGHAAAQRREKAARQVTYFDTHADPHALAHTRTSTLRCTCVALNQFHDGVGESVTAEMCCMDRLICIIHKRDNVWECRMPNATS